MCVPNPTVYSHPPRVAGDSLTVTLLYPLAAEKVFTHCCTPCCTTSSYCAHLLAIPLLFMASPWFLHAGQPLGRPWNNVHPINQLPLLGPWPLALGPY